MTRTIEALILATIFVVGILLGELAIAIVVQQLPGHSADPLCGRDCYPAVQR